LNWCTRFCRPLRNHSATWPHGPGSIYSITRLGNRPTSAVRPCFRKGMASSAYSLGSLRRVRRRLVRSGRGIGKCPFASLSWREPGVCHADEAAMLRSRNRPVAAFESGGRCIGDRRGFFRRGGLLGCGCQRRGLLRQGAARAPERDQYSDAYPHLGSFRTAPAADADGFVLRPACSL
jgi:hypothetical protein